MVLWAHGPGSNRQPQHLPAVFARAPARRLDSELAPAKSSSNCVTFCQIALGRTNYRGITSRSLYEAWFGPGADRLRLHRGGLSSQPTGKE